MTITLEEVQGHKYIMVLGIEGDLDASNYKTAIQAAKQVLQTGAKNLLIDMSAMTFMSSSGLIALHSIALLMRGEEPPDPEYGWEAFHSLDREAESSVQKRVKLLNPKPRVVRTMETTGLAEYFEVFTELDAALAAFS